MSASPDIISACCFFLGTLFFAVGTVVNLGRALGWWS